MVTVPKRNLIFDNKVCGKNSYTNFPIMAVKKLLFNDSHKTGRKDNYELTKRRKQRRGTNPKRTTFAKNVLRARLDKCTKG